MSGVIVILACQRIDCPVWCRHSFDAFVYREVCLCILQFTHGMKSDPGYGSQEVTFMLIGLFSFLGEAPGNELGDS